MAEIIGYVGSILVAVSLMMSNIWRLRWINLAGAVFFVIYGLAVKAYPVAVVNAFIVAIDAYYLGMLAGRKDYFNLMTVPRVTSHRRTARSLPPEASTRLSGPKLRALTASV